jgi:hypothetical protein
MNDMEKMAHEAFLAGKAWAPCRQGRPSVFTEREMEILMEMVKKHLKSPKDLPLATIARSYRITPEQVRRMRIAIEKKTVPFRTRPCMKERDPFSDRMLNPPSPEEVMKPRAAIVRAGEQKLEEMEENQKEKELLQKRGQAERIRDILLDTDRGRPIPDGAIHEILKLTAAMTESEQTLIKALQASKDVARQGGDQDRLGPPAPLTDGDKIKEVVTILHAVGIETGLKAFKNAYGQTFEVTRRHHAKDRAS